MVWELFFIGSFWFWAVIVVEALWLLRCLHEESGWGIGVSLLGLGILLWLFGDFNIFTWAWYNPILLLECAVGYVVLGIIWSLTRWKMLCVDVRDQLNEAKEKFRRQYKISGRTLTGQYLAMPDELRSAWRDYLNNKSWSHLRPYSLSSLEIHSLEDIIPQPREFKAKILYWLGYWPLSMLWFFFHDMIERVFNRIYQTFSRLYQSIAKGTFAGIPDDLGENDENNT